MVFGMDEITPLAIGIKSGKFLVFGDGLIQFVVIEEKPLMKYYISCLRDQLNCPTGYDISQ